ncbi:MAG: DUF1834 family protein [Burkholderiales bacterium]|nr:DUF1834 family protein [Burkholderiales bacterium]
MLAEAENGLIALIKAAPVGAKLREVASLPDLDGDSLVKKFFNDAPAVYVAPGSFQVRDRIAYLKFGLACVARNSRGHAAARIGDGKLIGLYEMMEAVAAALDGAVAGECGWYVTGCDFMSDEVLYKNGVYAGVVQIESPGVTLPSSLDPATLGDFISFRADYDIPPFETPVERDKWSKEPPDYSTSKPDVSETSTVQT